MDQIKRFGYEPFRTTLENGQMILVQIFRDLDTMEVIDAQLCFKSHAHDSWGIPYTLEVLP